MQLLDNIKSSHLFVLARLGRFPRHWTYPVGVLLYAIFVPFLGAFCLIPFLFTAILTGVTSLEGLLTPSSAHGLTLELVLSFLPFYFLVWGWVWIFERRKPWTIGLESGRWLYKYLRGLLIGVTMFGSVILLQALFGATKIESDPSTATGSAALASLSIVLIGWIIQGAAEEVLARGFVLPVIGVRWGATAGIILSAFFFTLLHLLNPGLNGIALLNLTLFGVFAALYALREGGLWGVFAIHTAWNWAQGNLFGLPVSGLSAGGTLFNFQSTGPSWFSGGSFGPESGLAVSVILIVACLVVGFYHRKKGLLWQ